jgi:hypothetical protein
VQTVDEFIAEVYGDREEERSYCYTNTFTVMSKYGQKQRAAHNELVPPKMFQNSKIPAA